jgi:hypothetical protein
VGSFLKHTSSKASSAMNQGVARLSSHSPRASELSPGSSPFAVHQQRSVGRSTLDSTTSAQEAATGVPEDAPPLVDTAAPASVAEPVDPFSSPLQKAPTQDSIAESGGSDAPSRTTSVLETDTADPATDDLPQRRTKTADSLSSAGSADAAAAAAAARGSTIAFEPSGQSEKKGVYIRMQARLAL